MNSKANNQISVDSLDRILVKDKHYMRFIVLVVMVLLVMEKEN
jgi:hypothetical protein